MLVVVDQFEEVFTLRPQQEEARGKFDRLRSAFFASLLYAATVPEGRVAVVLTMRSDFLGHCAPFPRLNDLLTANLEQVGPMQEHELREAIERPAFMVGGELDPGLSQRLVDDVVGQAGALPLLQFALDELWTKRRGRKLTRAEYDAMGGIAGALDRRANAIYANLSDEDKETCKRIFLRLVQPGEGVEDTKRRVPLDELVPRTDPVRADHVRRVIARLTDREARLVTTESAASGSPGAIEVAHEALIRGWKDLRQWIEDNRPAMRTRDGLTKAAQEWSEAAPEKRDDYLYFGARLAEAREWAAAHRDDLGDLESVFRAASEKAHQEEAKRERLLREEAETRARKQRLLRNRFVAVAVVAGILAAGSGALGWLAKLYGDRATDERDRALAQERIAESRRLASLSDVARPSRLDQARLLALEAGFEDTLEPRGSLQRSLDERPEVLRFLHVPGNVSSVAFGPGGRIAAGYESRGGGVVLLDAKGERLWSTSLEVKEGYVTSVVFGPDGTIAAGYGRFNGGAVVLLDAKGERIWPTQLEIKEGSLTSVDFGPDGTIAAGYGSLGRGGGVVMLDVDPASWRTKAQFVANRNFTREEWLQFFPDKPYRRTVRSFPWPLDRSEPERTQAETWEREHPELKAGS